MPAALAAKRPAKLPSAIRLVRERQALLALPLDAPLVVVWAYKLPSMVNMRFRHWSVEAREVKRQRGGVFVSLLAARPRPPTLPLTVELTRIAPREIQDPTDNLPAAFKHVRDGIADYLGTDDRDSESLVWRYGQAREGRRYAVVITLRPMHVERPVDDA